jgi:hypothetical protein
MDDSGWLRGFQETQGPSTGVTRPGCGHSSVEQRGTGLIRRLREIQPSLLVLYLADRSPAGDEAVEDGSTLQTPFSLDELQEAVAAAIDRRAR